MLLRVLGLFSHPLAPVVLAGLFFTPMLSTIGGSFLALM